MWETHKTVGSAFTSKTESVTERDASQHPIIAPPSTAELRLRNARSQLRALKAQVLYVATSPLGEMEKEL
eukprot:3215602-Rhodomonas_salina.2